MFDHVDLNSYDFDSVPTGVQCRLMTDRFLNEFESTIVEMVRTEDEKEHALYDIGYGSSLVVNQIEEDAIDVSWYVDAMERFHEVSIPIPRKHFVACVSCPKYSVQPYIFVSDAWHESILTKDYSVFCLIDAIGFKQCIRKGVLSPEILISLRSKIDDLAARNPKYSFISFADSLIVKTNWKPGYFIVKQESTYKPESLLSVIDKVREIYRDTINLGIYAVLTQGANEYTDESLLHISNTKNHVCMNSLGVPFAELLAIESTAKQSIKSGVHPPSELYLDEQYFHSMRFKIDAKGGASSVHEYKPIMKGSSSNYYCASLDVLMTSIE